MFPSLSNPEVISRAAAGTPGIYAGDLATAPITGNAVSTAAPAAMPSTPNLNLLRNRRAPSSDPVSPVSSSVFKKSGSASKLSDTVLNVVGATNTSAAPVAKEVDAASLILLPSIALPEADFPKASADLANLLAPGITFAPLATAFARPNQPTIGIATEPNVTIPSDIFPAVPVGVRFNDSFVPSKNSVTSRLVSVSNTRSTPAAPSSVIPCPMLITPAPSP